MDALARFLYRTLGRRYPRTILVLQFQVGHLVVLAGVSLFTLYQDMSTADFLKILAVAQVLMLIENVFGTRTVFELLRPADRWLRGDREPGAVVDAWRALAGVPTEFMRRRRGVPVVMNLVPVAVYITLELQLPWYALPILVAGGAVVLLYGLMLRFFTMELMLRPVVEDVARDLPDGVELGDCGSVSLRWKLLVGLPSITIVTGVTVSGLSSQGTAQIGDLGVDVLLTVLVAFTLSLELTVLLSRSVLGSIHDLRAATEKVAAGDLTVRVPVTSTDEAGSLVGAFNHMVAGLEERARLHEAFGAFVDPDLADRVLEEGHVFEGEELEVTVLFLDIREFTAFAERSSAKEVVDALNEFFGLVVPVLTRHGGHANKFIGDGLLGVFGAPDRRPDHADRAVAAAIEIAHLVRRAYGQRLRIGIGVNSGPVVAGTVGGGGKLEFTVIGDAVNTAARVEEVTRITGDDVLVTEATCALLTRDLGGFDERPTAELKGKTERVRLHAPRALAAQAPASLRAAGRTE